MKSALAAITAVVVLSTGMANTVQPMADFPPWVCRLIPMLCS